MGYFFANKKTAFRRLSISGLLQLVLQVYMIYIFVRALEVSSSVLEKSSAFLLTAVAKAQRATKQVDCCCDNNSQMVEVHSVFVASNQGLIGFAMMAEVHS